MAEQHPTNEYRDRDTRLDRGGFLTLDEIIAPNGVYPVSKSTWYAGIKEGRFPKQRKLGRRRSGWPAAEIRELIQRTCQT